jgi:sugar (pentulose or hexulose) kinase
VSDFHNALKMGVAFVSPSPSDKSFAETGHWPKWVSTLTDMKPLPALLPPGANVGLLSRPRALALGINTDCLIRAGTTDSIAAFLAAGVTQPGEAVTSLGTTLVLKLLSRQRVDAAQFGVYSHWFGHLWLTGGASNAGGGVLRQHFDNEALATLSARIDPNFDTGLNYLPLPCPGERFPVNDPTLQPRLTPKAENPVEFLQGMLEGLAQIEAAGYGKLAALGATPLSRVISTGGGAKSDAYTRIRARKLHVPIALATQQEACYGTARLACFGTQLFPGAQDD